MRKLTESIFRNEQEGLALREQAPPHDQGLRSRRKIAMDSHHHSILPGKMMTHLAADLTSKI